LRPRSPEAVEGRKHIDVQTELYLEELSDRVEEADVECQTDAFLDRPPSPLFVPAKTGVDVFTQILEGDVSAVVVFASPLSFLDKKNSSISNKLLNIFRLENSQRIL
jgi:hypothetical protein